MTAIDYSGGRSARWAPIALLASSLGLVGCAFAIGMPTQTDYPWSASVLLDGGWRMLQGQIPHQDFHTPIGPVYLLTVSAAMRLAGPGPEVLGLVAAAFFLFATGLCWLVSRQRMAAWPAAIAALAAGILALTPALFGSRGSDGISFGGHYTRVAWSLFTVVVLAAAAPPRSPLHLRARLSEAAIIGICLAVMAGCKVTFAVASVGVLAVAQAWGDHRRSLHELAVILLACLVSGAVLLFAAGTTLPAYIADLDRSATSAGMLRLVAGYYNELDIVWVAMFALGIALVGRHPWAAWRPSLLSPMPSGVLMIAAVTGSGIALSATNGIEHASPIVVAIALIAWARASRLAEAHRRRAVEMVAIAAVSAWTLRCLAPFVSILTHHGPAIATLEQGPYSHHEFLSAGSLEMSGEARLDNLSRNANALRTELWWQYLDQGCRLLRPHVSKGSRVLSLDFVNPFPYALYLPSARGDHLFWHFQRNITQSNAPTASELFRDADFVLEPRVPIVAESLDKKKRLYDEWLSVHATVVEENHWWRLFRITSP